MGSGRGTGILRVAAAAASPPPFTKGKCIDKTQADTKEFPYQGQVYLPEGNIVNGCCRRLKPGEAPVGPHGYVPNTPPPQ